MRSLRSRFLLLIALALVPLSLVSFWLIRTPAPTNGPAVIVVVAVVTLCLAILVTRRITRSLEELADATRAVAGGDLDRRVSERSATEAGRVGLAFNAMTASLRETLRQLSQREALVAVGQFAASLSHEIRNPLTSIRIDLQRVEEKIPPESVLRTHLERALREVERLDQTVSGALRIARSGSIALRVVDLAVPLRHAIEVATPEFDRRGAVLQRIGASSQTYRVRGDEAALEQLFLNILLNAAEALSPGGKAGVTVVVDAGAVQVDIWDSGEGIPADQLETVFDPFFSTKRDGTGLGLAVVRQIVNAHGGLISIDSEVDAGTTVSIRLSLVG